MKKILIASLTAAVALASNAQDVLNTNISTTPSSDEIVICNTEPWSAPEIDSWPEPEPASEPAPVIDKWLASEPEPEPAPEVDSWPEPEPDPIGYIESWPDEAESWPAD